MSNKPRICIELFHRDEITIAEGNLERLGWATYHWALLVRPKDLKQIGSCISFDVTDGIRLDPATRKNLNPTGTWWFRVRAKVNPLMTGHFLGAIEIGKLPKNIGIEQLQTLLSQLPLPQKNQNPDQNCATWIYDVIQAFQKAGYVPERDALKIMSTAMALAGDVMVKGPPKNVEDRFQAL